MSCGSVDMMYVDTQSLVRQSWCRPGRQPISRPERRDLKGVLSSDHANTTHHSGQSDHVKRAMSCLYCQSSFVSKRQHRTSLARKNFCIAGRRTECLLTRA